MYDLYDFCDDVYNPDLTIPEAVNMIAVVPDAQLQDLGRKLGLDEVTLSRISGYDPKEQHQRLIETWFEANYQPSREVLIDTLPRRESSASVSSVPQTPPSSLDAPSLAHVDSPHGKIDITKLHK